MSQLTSKTKIEYVAVCYYWDIFKGKIPDDESSGFDYEDDAIEWGEDYVRRQVEQYGRYAWTTIEKRVVPIYE